MDLNCKMNYASFYVYGLKKHFDRNIHFSSKKFQHLAARKKTFLFIVEDSSGAEKKFAIDFHDHRNAEYHVLEWCDYYAKINMHQETMEDLIQKKGNDYFEKHNKKIFSITPSFGIRVFGIFDTLVLVIKNFLNFKFSRKNEAISNVKDLLRTYVKRRPLEEYLAIDSKENYIFFIASIWEKTTDYINLQRANFIRACKQNQKIDFEGGFIDIGYPCDYIPDLGNLMYQEKKISLKPEFD